MTPVIVEFPRNLAITTRSDPLLVQNNRSAGVGMDGSEQILSPLTERWQWRASVPIVDKGAARSIRSVKSRLKGRYNYLLMSLCDQYCITRKDVGAIGDEAIPHFNGAYFSDGSGYSLTSPRSTVASPATAGNPQVVLRGAPFAGALTAGVWFSINKWLYHVDNWEPLGINMILDISPPLREAVVVDDVADFAAPALWTLQSDTIGDLDLNVGKFGEVNLVLDEPTGRGIY